MQIFDYNECKPRGTFDFPIAYYYVNHRHPQYVMAYHWHVEVEIIRILKGKFTVSLDEQEFTAHAGDTIWVGSGVLHAGRPENCIYECLVFDIQMLLKQNDACRPFLAEIAENTVTVGPILSGADPVLRRTVQTLFNAMSQKQTGYQLITKGGLYQFIGLVYQRHCVFSTLPQNSAARKNVALLKKVLTFIEKNYDHPITLADMSNEAGLSPNYFCRFFQEMTHRSPVDYLNAYRVERACYQLSSGAKLITEIAYSCGFNDLSYFIRAFKKYKGITPSKYRNITDNMPIVFDNSKDRQIRPAT